MTSKRPSSYLNSPQASRDEKIRNAKGQSTNTVGYGMSDAPNSRAKKFVLGFVVAMIVLFIVMDFIDRANAKKPKNSYHYEPIAGMSIVRSV